MAIPYLTSFKINLKCSVSTALGPSGANDSIASGCGEYDGDTEYSFPIDQVDDEKEEFRNDRAVKISSK